MALHAPRPYTWNERARPNLIKIIQAKHHRGEASDAKYVKLDLFFDLHKNVNGPAAAPAPRQARQTPVQNQARLAPAQSQAQPAPVGANLVLLTQKTLFFGRLT